MCFYRPVIGLSFQPYSCHILEFASFQTTPSQEDVRFKAFCGIEAELRHDAYQGFEEGKLRITK